MTDDQDTHAKSSADLKKDLSSLWKNTIDQFDEIKNAIVRSGEVGKSKLDATFLARQRDKLLTEFGRLIVEAYREGGLPLSETLIAKVARIEELDEEIKKADDSVKEFLDKDDEEEHTHDL